jgi:hypothetical protein
MHHHTGTKHLTQLEEEAATFIVQRLAAELIALAMSACSGGTMLCPAA